MISAERLRELLDYEPATGRFKWRVHKSRVSAGDYAGTLNPDGYWRLKIDQKTYLVHRLVWLWVTGQWPAELDHINGDPADSRIENLRECTRSQNFANRRAKAGRSLPKGVRFDPRGRRFGARIVVKGREISLGVYDTAEAASAAYMVAARKHYGEFASNGEIVVAPRER